MRELDLKTAFDQYGAMNPHNWNMAQRASLSLRRAGIDNLETLRIAYSQSREQLFSLQGIGPKAMEVLESVLETYDV